MDGKPRAATSTFTQLLSSEEGFGSVLLYVHRNRKDYYRWGAQDVHLDNLELRLKFDVALRPQRP